MFLAAPGALSWSMSYGTATTTAPVRRSRPVAMNNFLPMDASIAELETKLELLQKKVVLEQQLWELEPAASPDVTAVMTTMPEQAASTASVMMATSEQASTAPVALQPWVEWGGAVVDWAGTCADLLATDMQQQAIGLVPQPALDVLYTAQFVQSSVLAALSEALQAPLLGEMTAAGLALQLGVIAAFGLGGLVFSADTGKEDKAPYEAGTSTYDPKVADAFYRERPLLVARRVLTLARLTSTFTAGLLFDWLVLGKLLKDEEYTALKRAEPRRAKEALVLCEQLGTTFIKLGQALSIREDLIPTAYALELRQLQDAVPPFSSVEAFAVLREQLGVRDLNEVFSSNPNPNPNRNPNRNRNPNPNPNPNPNSNPYPSPHPSPHPHPHPHPHPNPGLQLALGDADRVGLDRAGVQGDAQGRHGGGGQGAAAGHPRRDRPRPARAPARHPLPDDPLQRDQRHRHRAGGHRGGAAAGGRVGARLRGRGRLPTRGQEHRRLLRVHGEARARRGVCAHRRHRDGARSLGFGFGLGLGFGLG
jgi:hypothetical protein